MSEPLSTTSRWSAILATGRVSNLPTVASNTLVAMLLCLSASPQQAISTTWFTPDFFPLFIIITLGASLLYIGGCFLGDVMDVEFDKKHKPSRPIPAGTLRRSTIYTSAWFLILSGTVTPLLLISAYKDIPLDLIELIKLWPIYSLPLCIILYSIYHKRSALLGLPLIGLCRFTLIIFASALTLWAYQIQFLSCVPILLVYGGTVAIFTVCFASVARTESSPSPVSFRKLLAGIMILLPLSSLAYFQLGTIPAPTIIAAFLCYWAWLGRGFSMLQKDKGGYVAICLAGFSLLDACFVSWLGAPWLLICLGLFSLALLLQRWAPAT